ncbi:MAG: MBL fold metallo-hydrolase [Gemmatimonadales bacterium]|nr:MAG: MBL fold metallo-hydrolase [Gemmatimonadales bacterium]
MERIRLTFLGTGTSFGIPVVGCDCSVCTSTDIRDRRSRHGALVSWESGGRFLVDTPPELRLQLLREGIDSVDAVWFTHGHADHLHGIDDLRIFSLRSRRSLPVWAPADTVPLLLSRFRYIFDGGVRPQQGTSKPELDLRTVDPETPEEILGRTVMPLPVPHGAMQPLGFRVGDVGYVTDAKTLPDRTMERLAGVRLLVLNALWRGRPHPTHFNVEEAVAMAERIGARRTYLTHLTHRLSHQELVDTLPPGVHPARDGLTVELGPDGIRESGTGEEGGNEHFGPFQSLPPTPEEGASP